MTELEKIAYAKSFIDKLATGVNPLDGSLIPDDELLNNIRISRCLFYVSDILRQILDNGGIESAPPALGTVVKKKEPFYLTHEQAQKFEFSETPITRSELLSRIYAVGPQEGVKKIPKKAFCRWLMSLGLLEYFEQKNGQLIFVPTEVGEEFGIARQNREGSPYEYIYYDLNAQHFILDNFDAFMTFLNEEGATRLARRGKPWTKEEDEKLVTMYNEGISHHIIAETLKRTKTAIRARLRAKELLI